MKIKPFLIISTLVALFLLVVQTGKPEFIQDHDVKISQNPDNDIMTFQFPDYHIPKVFLLERKSCQAISSPLHQPEQKTEAGNLSGGSSFAHLEKKDEFLIIIR